MKEKGGKKKDTPAIPEQNALKLSLENICIILASFLKTKKAKQKTTKNIPQICFSHVDFNKLNSRSGQFIPIQ